MMQKEQWQGFEGRLWKEELRTAGYEADHSRIIPGNSGA